MNAAIPNSSYKHQAPHAAGFTLIELMVTIAVLAIIVSIAAPSFNTQLANQRVNTTTSSIESALKEAKAESIILRTNIRVVYDNTDNTMTLRDASNNTVSTFTLDDRSQVTMNVVPAGSDVIFQPNKVISNGVEVTYGVCDSASTAETRREVRVTKIANISTITNGSC
ncbi:pilus assembly FimT family protein [Psychrobacter sp. 1Y11]|uniref:pilus assembly FimT family protein n=1 Tax=Psychrobacter sp. 1Y11 TaxID=3457446 RepID=UPI003FD36637